MSITADGSKSASHEITYINDRAGRFEFIPDETERLDREFASWLADLDAQAPQEPTTLSGVSAEIVDINAARARLHHPSRKRKSVTNGPPRTRFTPKPLG